MASKRILDFRFQISDFVGGCAAALVVLVAATAAVAETYAERAERVAKLSPEQKAELLRKKDRFDALTDDQKERLRDLHESLASAPDAQQLQELLTRYSNWLKGLQPSRRAEVLDLPADKRIARIKDIVRQQEGERFRDFVNYNLPDDDQKRIHEWLDQFVGKHEEEILDALRDDDRRRVRRIDDDRTRRRTLITRLGFRRPDSKMPFPTKEEINTMVEGLSSKTREELEKAQDPNVRQGRAYELVFGAIWSISFPPPSAEELSDYFAQLPPERRSKLENMDPEELQKNLRQMHRQDKYGWRGPPRGGDGFRGPRSGSPGPPGPPGPDLNRQPPGFANPKTKKG